MEVDTKEEILAIKLRWKRLLIRMMEMQMEQKKKKKLRKRCARLDLIVKWT